MVSYSNTHFTDSKIKKKPAVQAHIAQLVRALVL